MVIVCWVGGMLLALGWLVRAVEAFYGMRTIVDLTAPGWARQPASLPLISVIVPARNEAADIERCLRSLVAQDYPVLEIVAVNDRSGDATGALMSKVAAEHPARLRVIHVRELPAGWLGKTHAMWLAASQARGEWLLFTDGDIFFEPSVLSRSLGYAQQAAVDHLVLFPTAIMQSIGERMMMAFFALVSLLANRPWKIPDPRAREHVGIGAFNMVRMSAYQAIGTYESLRLNVIDDLALGCRLKEYGYKQRLVAGHGLVSLHWAKGALGIVGNLQKNFFALLKFRLDLTIAVALLTLILNLGPFLGVVLAPGFSRIGYGLALGGMAALYLHLSRILGISPFYLLLHPIATLLVTITMLNSAFSTIARGGIFWRGTKYSLRELRKHL